MASDIRELVQQLQQPITDFDSLVPIISALLDAYGLLPAQYSRYNTQPLSSNRNKVTKYVPVIQRALLEQVIPTWDSVLKESGLYGMVEQFFCPDLFLSATPNAGEVALSSYSCIIASPFTEFSIDLFTRLVKLYTIDKLHSIIFAGRGDDTKEELAWEECVQNVISVPAKVANHFAENIAGVPETLETGAYFTQIFRRSEDLIHSAALSPVKHYSSISYLLAKLAKLGMFSLHAPIARSQPSFFHTVLPVIRRRLSEPGSSNYANSWYQILQEFSSASTLRVVVGSLFASLESVEPLDTDIHTRAFVRREARLLHDLCPLRPEDEQLWESVSSLILNNSWSEGHARILVGWISLCGRTHTSDKALHLLLDDVINLWTSPEHVKHSLIAYHRYLTLLLILMIAHLPRESMSSTSSSSRFMGGVSTYITQMDDSIRHYGMLVAEIVAQRAGKDLNFDDWDGDNGGKPWCRQVRDLIKTRDIDVEVRSVELRDEKVNVQAESVVIPDTPQSPPIPQHKLSLKPSEEYDSDDSMTMYNSPPSSRSNSPTPSELEDIENDPSLAVGTKKIQKPVYLAQLGSLIRGPVGLTEGSSNDDADKIEMALDVAEELIRKKKDFGTELDENAVNLVYGFIALQDNYNLPGFSLKRQNALNALVACCPRKAAPYIIEEFFKNQYSTDQRYAMLNALALGARELASLSIPESASIPTFPSKRLPGPWHQKYIQQPSSDSDMVPQLLEGITRAAIEKGSAAVSDKVPEIVRERRLRVQKPAKIVELPSDQNPRQNPTFKQKTSFKGVAAEFFIGPLINRFWLFLRDEQSREERTAHLAGRGQYHGAGTGLILNPLVLTHFLRTLALLVHASLHASEWLAVIAPNVLELAVTIGTRPISRPDSSEDDDAETEQSSVTKEAAILSSALELSLVVLDGCLEVDQGRSLSMERAALLMGANEWAGGVISALESGVRVPGGGGEQEVSLRRAAAGVVLKIDEITSQWRRSMINLW